MIAEKIEAQLKGAPEKIEFDGRVHRFQIEGSKRDAGWYVARLSNGFPLVQFGSWLDGSRYVIRDDELVDADALERSRAERRRERHDKTKQAEQTATLANLVWKQARPIQEHPALARKGLTAAHGVRQFTAHQSFPKWFSGWIDKHDLRGAVVVPMMKADRIVDLQFITPIVKRFLPHGDHVGATYRFGNANDSATIVISTGFATSATIHECTGYPVIAAFSDSNLDAVAKRYRDQYPQAVIIVAGDNDLRDDPKKLNSGLVTATAVAKRHNCLLAIPELDNRKVDFNDLFLALGKQAVIDQINAALPVKSNSVKIDSAKASELLALAYDDWLLWKDWIAVKAPAGLGKTTMLVKRFVQSNLRVDYFVPSYSLAMEQAARLPAGTAIAIRGRTHQTENNPPLCAKWESAQSLEKAGLAHRTMFLLCGKIDRQTGKRPCPYAGNCGYLQQFYSKAPIRFYAHEYLPLDSNKLMRRDIDVAVVDETFHDSLEKVKRWSIGELLAQPETIYRDLVNAITEDRLLAMGNSVDVINGILKAEDELESHLRPEMDAATAAQKAKPLLQAQRKPTLFLWNCKKAIEGNGVNRLWFRNVDGGSIFAAWVKPIKFIAKETPTAFLDASLVEPIIKRINPDCRVVKIEATRLAHITQITDSALSYRRLKDDKDYLSSRLLEFVQRQAAVNPNGAVIAPLFWIESHKDRFPPSVKFAHFGGLRGLNTLEHCDWLVQISRYQPPPYAVEQVVRAWFPEARLTLPGAYINQQRTLEAKTGAGALVWAHTHSDPRCREVLESIREQESLQALDRLRLIHGKVKQIWLFSNHPLPGIEPDVLATLDNLTLPGRFAEVVLRDGVAVTDRKVLCQRYPDVFTSEKAAKEYLDRCSFIGPFSNSNSIRDRANENDEPTIDNTPYTPTVKYRMGKARGGPPKNVIVTAGGSEETKERLEQIHGKPVVFFPEERF